MQTINLGDKVRDAISGFEGIVVCISHWFNGCTRIVVQSQQLKDGKTNSETFDPEQLDIIEINAVPPRKQVPQTPVARPAQATGGPTPDAIRPAEPQR